MKKNEIENIILDLEERTTKFINRNNDNNKKSSFLSRTIFYSKSFFSFIKLLFLINFNKKISYKNFVFISSNFVTKKDNKNITWLLNDVHIDNIVFINHSKENNFRYINNFPVYNIGGVIKIVDKLLYRNNKLHIFYASKLINDLILKKIKSSVYTFCFYDINSLAVATSKYRKNFNFIEIQHGSIINYPPYEKEIAINIPNIYYVKNAETIHYLKNHLCKNKDGFKYNLLNKKNRVKKNSDKIQLLYASSLEVDGFHPVFIKFLKDNTIKNIHIIIRLHPREKHNLNKFKYEIIKYNISYHFDNSINWKEENNYKNLIVISPWSSIIEEAVDENINTIIIDEIGKKRYSYLLQNSLCKYTNNLEKEIKNIIK